MSTGLQTVADFAARVRVRMEALNRELAKHEGARESVAKALADAEARVQETGNEAEILNVVLELLHAMEGDFQRNFQRSLAGLVSEGLSQVFDEELEVRIEKSTRADMSAIHFVLIKGGEEEDLMNGQGGGYINVIAFLLRVLLILAARPLLRRLLVLDEPFAQLSEEFHPTAAEMVQALVDRLDFQVIMVTHSREYAEVADVAIKVEMKGGATQFHILRGAPEEAAVV
jgi:DNA repair exonuclease SbcCD ATPase subunit